MQLFLLVALPSVAQMSSLLLCGLIVGRVHYKMITTRSVMSMQTFSSVIVSCASIQIVCKIIDHADLTAMSKIMQMVMSH